MTAVLGATKIAKANWEIINSENFLKHFEIENFLEITRIGDPLVGKYGGFWIMIFT